MSKLDELKQLVADIFKDANDKTAIEKAAVINSKVNEIEAEEKELMDRNKELLDSYKEVVLHTSVTPTLKTTTANDAAGGTFMDFEEYLNQNGGQNNV